jgi:hypothetical protein
MSVSNEWQGPKPIAKGEVPERYEPRTAKYEGGRSGVKYGLPLLVLTIILVIVRPKFAKEASDFVKDMKVEYNKLL